MAIDRAIYMFFPENRSKPETSLPQPLEKKLETSMYLIDEWAERSSA
jgi:hypothetical protein